MIARKIITATLAALTLGATVAATSTPAAAWGHRHYGWGGGALVGGLAAGALLGGVIAANSAPYYGSCYLARRPVFNRWGDVVGYRRTRVCE